MGGLSDSLTIAILLVLIFGAVAFYLYSRLSQNEKRIGLLENLLLTLKMNTEASLGGPETIEPISGPAPLDDDDVESVQEGDYAELLASVPAPAPIPAPAPSSEHEESELSRAVAAIDSTDAQTTTTMDVNYESMTLKELQALARQRGLSGIAARKRDLIHALKDSAPPAAPTPLTQADGELEGGVIGERGFQVDLQSQ